MPAGQSIQSLHVNTAAPDKLGKSPTRSVQEDIRVKSVKKSRIRTSSDVPSSVSLKIRKETLKKWLKLLPYADNKYREATTKFQGCRIRLIGDYGYHTIDLMSTPFPNIAKFGSIYLVSTDAYQIKDVTLLYKMAIDLLSEPAILAFELSKSGGCITINTPKMSSKLLRRLEG